MFENLTTREKWIIIFAVLSLLVAGYLIYVREPYQEDIEALEQEVMIEESSLEEARRIASRLPELEEEYEELADEHEEVVDKSKADILNDFETATENNGLTLEEFWPEEASAEGIPYQMRIEGTYQNFLNMFEEVEDWKKWLNFTSLQLTAQDDGTLAAEITAVYPEQEETGGDTDE
ncbi:MAG: type 4a pilus biogenesis protein PilO [Bacillota bacterium]